MKKLTALISLAAVIVVPAPAGADSAAGRYIESGTFLERTFPSGVPESRTLWIRGDVRENLETVLGHPFGALRVRSWYDGTTSAWILDEVGKELPITIGIAVQAGAIRDVYILEFRESRGWEVRYPFFTDQFRQAKLEEDGRLDRRIDGITGATLSVKAVTRTARAALLLHDALLLSDEAIRGR